MKYDAEQYEGWANAALAESYTCNADRVDYWLGKAQVCASLAQAAATHGLAITTDDVVLRLERIDETLQHGFGSGA